MSDDSNSPAAARPSREALPPGTRFGEFDILRVLGVGGFGVVYLANDYSLERQVALKEYMPASLAVRGEGPKITIRSKAHEKTYAMGLRSFVNEARLLAKFDHPALVKVYRFWEDNGTAYMVMPYLQGTTLRDKRKTMGAPPKEAWLRQILDPMLEALEQLHGEGIYHRDIAPDNIFLPISGGAPILLDFGAARQVISDRTQTLTAILKPSYAPIEQYADTGMRQGAWTDLYALGAVMHFLLFGAPPAPSTARAMQGDAVPIDQRRVPGVSPQFMSVIAWMLGVRPTDRPQSVAALRAVLRGEAEVPVPVNVKREAPASAAPASAQAYEKTMLDPSYQRTVRAEGSYDPTRVDTAHQPTMHLEGSYAPTQLDTAHQQTVLQTRAAFATPLFPTQHVPTAKPPQPASPRAGRGSRLWLMVGAAVVVVAAAAVVAVWQFGGSARTPATLPVTR